MIINHLRPKTHETTGNEPENPESFLQGLRNAFLQHQPYHPNPPSTSKNTPLPENETTLITNDLATKTHENTRNKPESFLQGLRNAFLQHQPNHPNPPSTSKNTQNQKMKQH